MSPFDEAEAAVETAIKTGYRHIDTATAYKNERAVGNAIQKCIKEGIIKREDIFITTKLWVTDWKAENVRKSIAQSLIDLQTDYIDLLLIHQAGFLNLPEDQEKHRQENYFFDYPIIPPNDPKYRLGYNEDCVREAWTTMEEAVREGKVRSIGISNFSTKKVLDLLRFCQIKPVMNQVELHPYLQQWETMKTLGEHGILLTAYFPLGGAMNMASTTEVPLIKDPRILNIAEKHGKTAAQVLIRWAIQRGTVCIPKSVHDNRIKENFAVFDFELSEEEMNEIKAMDRGHRFANPVPLLYAGEQDVKKHWDNEYVNSPLCLKQATSDCIPLCLNIANTHMIQTNQQQHPHPFCIQQTHPNNTRWATRFTPRTSTISTPSLQNSFSRAHTTAE